MDRADGDGEGAGGPIDRSDRGDPPPDARAGGGSQSAGAPTGPRRSGESKPAGAPTGPREGEAGLTVQVVTTAHGATDARVVNREAVTLAEAGHRVTYLVPDDAECPVPAVAYDEPTDGVPGVGRRLRRSAALLGELAGSDADVVHLHDPEALPVGVVWGWLADGAVVYDAHEDLRATLASKPLVPEPVRPAVARAAGLVERGLARLVDGVVAASGDVAERFGGEPVAVVRNYPERRWAEATDPDGHCTPDPAEPLDLVYRGLLSADRGVLDLIEAVERVPADLDVRLQLGGTYASPAERERIEARIADSDRTEFVEWFPSLEGMVQHLREADVGLMCFRPSPNKTRAAHRSNKLFQYMAAGLPVVVSDVGNWPAVVEGAGAGVAVEPGDPDAVASAVADLAADADRRERLGRAAHRAALEEYNWSAEADSLLELYERLTAWERDAAQLPSDPTTDRRVSGDPEPPPAGTAQADGGRTSGSE